MGLASGAELDVLSYLATRYLGLRNRGTIMGVLLSILTVFAGLWPLLPRGQPSTRRAAIGASSQR